MIKAESAMDLMLVNELGQLIKTISLNETNLYQASVEDLAGGIYFITGQLHSPQVRQKIVITK